ncbi:unnamed protein product, partial [Discosporangium mesarthrocarpum]
EVPTVHRTSYCKWAAKAGVRLSSLWCLCKRVGVRGNTRWVKPTLTDKQRVDRVGFVLSQLHRRSGSKVLVDDMFDWVHMDEYWFYLMKDGQKVYLQPDEEVPKAPRASIQRFILKMVFLAAVAHPRKLSNEVWSDGKIGIWPIVDVVMAQRASKRGDHVLRPVTYKEIMIAEIIPAIKAKMPRPPGHTIFVQQDGAKPHTKKGVMEASSRGWEQHHTRDPAFQLPRPHVNDVGFFQSIQQLKEDVGVTTAEGLVEATFEAFDIYPRETLECVWHSLFAVYMEILESKGDNSYNIPHSGKEQAQKKGGLPKNRAVDQTKYHTRKAFWRASGGGT